MSDFITGALLGALVWTAIIFILIAGYGIGSEELKKKYYFKCVEMKEMPLGACSRLFGEGK